MVIITLAPGGAQWAYFIFEVKKCCFESHLPSKLAYFGLNLKLIDMTKNECCL